MVRSVTRDQSRAAREMDKRAPTHKAARMTDIADLTATETLSRIAAGTLTFAAVREALAGRIADREPAVRAFAYLNPAPTSTPGPLHGAFVGVKDVLDTADQPSQYGSPIWAGWQPRADAACVALARRAGAAIMGKTVTTEFATRFPGPTTNPHNQIGRAHV